MKRILETPAWRLAIVVMGVVIPAGSLAGRVFDAGSDTGAIRGVVKDRLVLRNPAVLYSENIDRGVFPPPKTPAVMDQNNLTFVPHVLPVLVGTTVDFPNSDSVRHSVFSTKTSATKFNLGTYDIGMVKKVVFDKPGVTSLLCNVHAEMSAYVVAVEAPYLAVTDRRGNFVIEDVPAGRYRLTMWHERLKQTTLEVKVVAGETVTVEFTGLKTR